MSYVSDLSSKQISAIKKENLFSMNNLENIKKTNYIIFCLPKPPLTKNKPDISMIKSAFTKVKPYLKKIKL